MIEKVLGEKLRQYAPKNAVDQENVLSELLQHFVLVGLSRAGFFGVAQFHGGTFLRIFHGLDRFSEDLDFVLKEDVGAFDWKKFLNRTCRYLSQEGIQFEVTDKSKTGGTVQKAIFKTDVIGDSILTDLPHLRDSRRKIRIKLEIDVSPPAGSTYTTSYLSFPVLCAVTTQTLESAFASKSHALLCRKYMKGRDWYDFLWYVENKRRPNLALLENAIFQQGPWAGRKIKVDEKWYLDKLEATVERVDWRLAVEDVRRFLPGDRQEGLSLWSTELFKFQISRLFETLRG